MKRVMVATNSSLKSRASSGTPGYDRVWARGSNPLSESKCLESKDSRKVVDFVDGGGGQRKFVVRDELGRAHVVALAIPTSRSAKARVQNDNISKHMQ